MNKFALRKAVLSHVANIFLLSAEFTFRPVNWIIWIIPILDSPNVSWWKMQTPARIQFRLLINYMVKRGPEFSLFRRTVNRIQSLFLAETAQRIQIIDPLLRDRWVLSPRNSSFPQFIPSNEPLVLVIDLQLIAVVQIKSFQLFQAIVAMMTLK